jgi:hypothetical protein
MERIMPDKPITWQQGIAVVGGAFGLCCIGFMLLHGMILADKTYAAEQLAKTVEARTQHMNRMADMFESYRMQNDKDHKEIMIILLSIKREIK